MLASVPSGAAAQAVTLLVMLASAAVVATLFRRLKLELIPGYLIAGAIVGPYALGFVPSSEGVDDISALAIVLLMFSIGLHLDLSAMRRGMVHIISIGVATTLGVTLLMWFAGLAMGLKAPAALAIAMAVAMSSTAVLVRVLLNRRESRTLHGRVTLGIAIVQDMAAVVVLALIPPLARWAGASFSGLAGEAVESSSMPVWAQFLSAAGVGLGGIVVMLFGGRIVLPRILVLVARTGSSELVLVVSAAIALGAAIGTAALGFSPEMGAFLAGFLLAGTPFRYQLAGQLAPLRDLLMAVFFTAVGMRVSPEVVAQNWMLVLTGAVLIVVIKGVIIGGASWLAGMSGPSSLLSGVYLANAGEFSLVALSAAGVAGVLTANELGGAIAAVILSLIVSPVLIGPAHRWAERMHALPRCRWARKSALSDAPDLPAIPRPAAEAGPRARRHVVIAGFGPVGRALADRFATLGVPFTVVELNPRTVQRQATLGREVVYGDITNPDVLEQAGVDHADAVVLTIPDDEVTLRACKAIRAAAPDVFIAARTAFLSGKFVALQLGADLVTVEEVATAQAMEREVLAALEKRQSAQAGYRPVSTPA